MKNPFFIKILNYEYWPMWAFYLPLFPYFIMKGLLNRHLFYFTNANPGIDEFGGLFFDSKNAIDQQFTEAYRPQSIRILPSNGQNDWKEPFKNMNLGFPLIAKPDAGERGKGVVKINSDRELTTLLDMIKTPYLLQEFINLPLEYGVFVAYIPEIKRFKVVSLTEKIFFSVIGNGISTISELIIEKERGKVFYNNLKERSAYAMNYIPGAGEHCVIHQLGNHCNGTEFLNRNEKLSEELDDSFNRFMFRLDGLKYGRFDIKVETFEDLLTFNNLKIMEFNGIAAEPTHIYDQRVGYAKALKSFIEHWHLLDAISKENKRLGFSAASQLKVINKLKSKLF